jgi:putative transposase
MRFEKNAKVSQIRCPGVLHHIMGRGIEGNNIFIGDKDRQDLIRRLSAVAEEGAMDVYARALLPNHFHITC